MNRQTVLGFVLIAVILFGFTWYQGKQQQKFQEQKRIEDSIAWANAPHPIEPLAIPDSLRTAAGFAAQQPSVDPLGEMMAAARTAAQQRFTVSNDVVTYEFSTLGGTIADVVLKEYKKYGGEPLHMWKPGTESFDVSFFLRRDGRDAQVNTREFVFTPVAMPDTGWREDETEKQIVMRLPVDSLAFVEFVYTIPRADYMIGYEVRFVGMEGRLSNQSSFEIDWANTSIQNEKGFENENRYTTIAYRYPGEKGVEQLGIQNAGVSKSENEPSRMQWVAFKQHYFSSFIIAADAFQGADMGIVTSQPGEGTVKKFHARVGVPMERDRTDYGFRMYFGPNLTPTLRSYDLSMDRIVSMGWMSFGFITRTMVIPIFDWLGDHIASFGWIILILTLIIKTLISPLTFASYKSSAKMRVIKPEMDEINAKYPDQTDAMKKQQATMELYRRAGINPLAGCLPMLIQMPFLLAMFRFFPEAIELRGQRLWWADDLSSYDSIIDLPLNIPFYGDHVSLFTLLLAVAIHLSSRVTLSQQTSQPQMAGMKFMSLWLMPIMMLFFLNKFAAGLNYYYLISTMFSLAQIYLTRAFINEDKLRRKMLETPRKEKPKSKFMQRIEEAQKAQMAAQRAQQQAQSRGGNAAPPPIRGPRGNAPGTTGKKKR
ncbi:MAG: membrane protein insertase YidC [Alistipes sp.]|jgi:YidC/Oxa1 family membrane protein insertase|nr:membrane protein insertase YidC [Alistipes sp.]